MLTKPMLAGKAPQDLAKIHYPVLASPKLDGIRAVMVGGKLLSRSFKPIPNEHIRTTLEAVLPNGVDGELIVGDSFSACTSGIMSKKGEPAFTYYVFDFWTEGPFKIRLDVLRAWVKSAPSFVEMVPQAYTENAAGLAAYEEACLTSGYEGVIIRDPQGAYKCGRSTTKEGGMLKLKRFEDAEALIVDYEEELENTNVATKDNLGHTKRSSAKAGKVGKGTLGKFIVLGVTGKFKGVTFKIGTGQGLTQGLRQTIWDNRAEYKGLVLKYRYQDFGSKDKPRIPIFIGWRSQGDM